MLQGLETYECIFRWSARLTPGFCAPLCLSAFFTQAPLRNVVFWIAFASILCCFCVYAAYHRNNRYLLVPFIAFKLIFFLFLSLLSFYVMIRHTSPISIDHLKDVDEVFDSYLRYVITALLNGLLTCQCIVFMYLALTIIYDIEYIRYFDAERNIRQQRAEERREEQENIVAEVGIN